MLQVVAPMSRRPQRVRANHMWTYRESEILREHWPDMETLRRRMPHRRDTAIKAMAKRCGLVPAKQQHVWTGAENKMLKALVAEGKWAKEIANLMGLTVDQVKSRQRYCGIQFAKRPPRTVGHPLTDEIRQRAHDRKMTMIDLDRSLGKGKIFSQNKPATPNQISHAVAALGGRLAIVWDDEE